MVSAIRVLNRAEDDSSQHAARQHLGEELADCLPYILKLANYAEINLQDAYLEKMQRNRDRNWGTKQDRSA